MKQCFKCKKWLDRSMFYRHSEMEDGLLGKCKDCTKSDTIKQYNLNRKNSNWVAKERERCRIKSNKNRPLYAEIEEEARKRSKAYRLRNKDKKSAQGILYRAVQSGKVVRPKQCSKCKRPTSKIQGHHHDYSKPLEVTWLCSQCHGFIHRKPI